MMRTGEPPIGEDPRLVRATTWRLVPRSLTAPQLERLRPELEGGGLSVEVVDVMQRPDLAERARILATPVLMRLAPLPRRSIIGDLSDWRVVAEVLELQLGRGGPGKANEPGDD